MTSFSLAAARVGRHGFELLGQLLDLFLDAVALVFGQRLVLLLLVGRLVAVAADVADGDLGLFGQLLDAGRPACGAPRSTAAEC